jgi:RNA polymerase sigma factor (sigma-70 family)
MSDDAQLVADLLAGDSTAIATVQGWIRKELWRYRDILRADAEDLEQDILLQLMEALDAGRFRFESALQTYVRSHAKFACIDVLRAGGRRVEHEVDQVEHPELEVPADFADRRENEDLARKVLEEVPESCRELWRMVLAGLSYREMSSRLGTSEGSLRVRVHRCRQHALEIRQKLFGKSM